ncbi:MAG TPA: PTS sugar transporter subunit IIA [Clostridia bacterium]|nr:PTS sugar transporter subunit IIA [Clostridia bacterium]
MLKQMLTKEYMISNARPKDWENAIEIAGKLLVDNGNVKAEYVQAMIDVVSEMGPYIVLCPGVAFAHARPESGTIKPGISLAILEAPIEFGHETNDPVKIVMAFAGKDHNSHLEMLVELSNILQDEKALERLVGARSIEDIEGLLNDYS